MGVSPAVKYVFNTYGGNGNFSRSPLMTPIHDDRILEESQTIPTSHLWMRTKKDLE